MLFPSTSSIPHSFFYFNPSYTFCSSLTPIFLLLSISWNILFLLPSTAPLILPFALPPLVLYFKSHLCSLYWIGSQSLSGEHWGSQIFPCILLPHSSFFLLLWWWKEKVISPLPTEASLPAWLLSIPVSQHPWEHRKTNGRGNGIREGLWSLHP